MDVSIIIATYNRRRILERSLECLFQQEYPSGKYEIIVIDDGSTDGTENMVEKKTSSCRLVLLRNSKRVGQSKSRNRAINKAQGEVIIFVDSDVFTPPWFIKEHLQSHEKDSHLIVDGPAINVLGEENLFKPAFTSSRTKLLAFLDLAGAHFITANTSCRRKSLIEAGGFDEDFGTGFGWQDRELGYRLERSGLRRIKNRRAYVLHYRSEPQNETNLQNLWQKRKDRGINAALFYKKHPEEKVRKMTRFRYLRYSHFLEKLGWGKNDLDPEYLLSLSQKKKFRYYIYRKIYLIHAYAEGLKEGIEKYKVEINHD